MSDVYRIADFGPSDLLTSPVEGVRRVKTSLPEELFDGVKAITVQPFTEVNSKLGTQYEAAIYAGAVAAGASVDIVLQVGDQPILMKEIGIGFNVDEISAQWFRGPTYTGGDPVAAYNLNDELAVPEDVTILGLPTVSDTGTAVSPLIHSLGSEGTGNRRISNVSQRTGVERVLWNNATYLFRITNENAVAAKVSGLATWYQGPLSTQTPLEQ